MGKFGEHNIWRVGLLNMLVSFKFGDDLYQLYTHNATVQCLVFSNYGDFLQTHQFLKLKSSPDFPVLRYLIDSLM